MTGLVDNNPPENKRIRIDNFDDIAKYIHRCESQPLLTDIQVNLARHTETMIHLESYFQELNARFDEQNATLQQFISDTGQRVRLLENAMGHHDCKKDQTILELTRDIASIKNQLAMYQGESKWQDRIWQVVQALIGGTVLAVIIWFMKGGQIG